MSSPARRPDAATDTRHRTQLLAGMEPEESVARATGTSGNAVLFAGLTVIIALAALVVPGLPFLSVMGLAAAGSVAVAVLVALSLTPAMLSLIGLRRHGPQLRRRRHRAHRGGGRIPGPASMKPGHRNWNAARRSRPKPGPPSG